MHNNTLRTLFDEFYSAADKIKFLHKVNQNKVIFYAILKKNARKWWWESERKRKKEMRVGVNGRKSNLSKSMLSIHKKKTKREKYRFMVFFHDCFHKKITNCSTNFIETQNREIKLINRKFSFWNSCHIVRDKNCVWHYSIRKYTCGYHTISHIFSVLFYSLLLPHSSITVMLPLILCDNGWRINELFNQFYHSFSLIHSSFFSISNSPDLQCLQYLTLPRRVSFVVDAGDVCVSLMVWEVNFRLVGCIISYN